ncbi:hypothetical protein N9Y17_01380 [Gammaproteobacteria bacterium]|nr:hypothetical protein [Gammaproteobacteria bacterium]
MKCQQPYLYIDQHHTLHVWLPLSKGVYVGTDNTCETTGCLQDFFGKRPRSEDGQAIISLKNLIDELKHLDAKQVNQIIKNDLIDQAEYFIDKINELKTRRGFGEYYKRLIGLRPFGDRMTHLIQSTGNIKTVTLSVPKEHDDPYTKLRKTDFTLPHRSIAFDVHGDKKVDPESDHFGKALRAVTSQLTPQDEAERISQNMQAHGYCNVQLTQIDEPGFRETFIQALSQVTGYQLSQWLTFQNHEMNYQYFVNQLHLKDEVHPVSDIVETLYHSLTDQLATNDGQNLQGYRYGFKGHGVSIAIQLYLAHLSFYSQYLGHEQLDLGELLEQDQSLREQLIDALKDNLHGDLRCVMFDHLKDHLCLESCDFEQVNEWYQSNISVIMQEDQWHPDEYMLLNPYQRGRAFVFDNQIVINFLDFRSMFYGLQKGASLDHLYEETIDHEQEMINHEVLLPNDQDIKHLMDPPANLRASFDQYPVATARWLISQKGVNDIFTHGKNKFAKQWHEYLQTANLNELFKLLSQVSGDKQKRYQCYQDILKYVGYDRYFDAACTLDKEESIYFYNAIIRDEHFLEQDFSPNQVSTLLKNVSSASHNTCLKKLVSLQAPLTDMQQSLLLALVNDDKLTSFLSLYDIRLLVQMALQTHDQDQIFDRLLNHDIGRTDMKVLCIVAQHTKSISIISRVLAACDHIHFYESDELLDYVCKNLNFSFKDFIEVLETNRSDFCFKLYQMVGPDEYFAQSQLLTPEKRQLFFDTILSSQSDLQALNSQQMLCLAEHVDLTELDAQKMLKDDGFGQAKQVYQAILNKPFLSSKIIRLIIRFLSEGSRPYSADKQTIIAQLANHANFRNLLYKHDLDTMVHLACRTSAQDQIFEIMIDHSSAVHHEKVLSAMTKKTNSINVIDKLIDRLELMSKASEAMVLESICHNPTASISALSKLPDVDQSALLFMKFRLIGQDQYFSQVQALDSAKRSVFYQALLAHPDCDLQALNIEHIQVLAEYSDIAGLDMQNLTQPDFLADASQLHDRILRADIPKEALRLLIWRLNYDGSPLSAQKQAMMLGLISSGLLTDFNFIDDLRLLTHLACQTQCQDQMFIDILRNDAASQDHEIIHTIAKQTQNLDVFSNLMESIYRFQSQTVSKDFLMTLYHHPCLKQLTDIEQLEDLVYLADINNLPKMKEKVERLIEIKNLNQSYIVIEDRSMPSQLPKYIFAAAVIILGILLGLQSLTTLLIVSLASVMLVGIYYIWSACVKQQRIEGSDLTTPDTSAYIPSQVISDQENNVLVINDNSSDINPTQDQVHSMHSYSQQSC